LAKITQPVSGRTTDKHLVVLTPKLMLFTLVAAIRLLSVSQRAARLFCRDERMVIKSEFLLDTVASWGFRSVSVAF
jgi:hypothetical protein